jgi:Xaa-Pro dipeptidase
VTRSTRRAVLQLAAAAGAAALWAAPAVATKRPAVPPITPAPISAAERLTRIARAQQRMRKAGLKALLVEAGSSLDYFTGIQWRRSERLTAAVIPDDGETLVVTPHFEEPSVRETLGITADVRTWHEHENPAARIADWLRARGAGTGPVGIEETVRFFAVDSLRRLGIETRDDAGVVRACRVIKSPAEIALMQRAADITLAAYADVAAQLKPDLPATEIATTLMMAMARLGGTSPWALILPNEASAYPHGTGRVERTKAGGILLMDCGCAYEGYQSDISRTVVIGGEASERQRQLWDLVRRGQQIAFETARIGTPAGAVDDAVRVAYEKAGYGPGYALPGLSHRTGHGIGMDGHEPVNLVHGERATLQPGMCFSNEPGIYIPGEFGVRLEDCIYMTEAGPRWFSTPPATIDDALA